MKKNFGRQILCNQTVSYIFVTETLHNEKRCVSGHSRPYTQTDHWFDSQNPLNLNAVSEKFPISRPAISKHIRILTECGLIEIKQSGRERYCYANLQQLREVNEWTEKYRIFWTQKLDALENFLAKSKKRNQEISLSINL